MAVGPLEMTLAVSRLRKSGLMVRPPMAEGGVPAISAVPEVWSVIEKSAVGAVAGDPVAREHVLAEMLNRVGVGRAGSAGGSGRRAPCERVRWQIHNLAADFTVASVRPEAGRPNQETP